MSPNSLEAAARWALVALMSLAVGCVDDSVVGATGDGGSGPRREVASGVGLQPTAAGSSTRTAIGARPGEQLGRLLESLGDLDGDGFGDFMLTAEPEILPNVPVSGQVVVYVFYGRTGFPSQLSTADADVVISNSVHAANGVGDLNGDALDDLVLVGPSWAQLVFGSRERLSGVRAAVELGVRWSGPDAPFGLANMMDTLQVTPAGDVNGDGLADLLVGMLDVARVHEADRYNPWRSFLVLGRAGGWRAGEFSPALAIAEFGAQDPGRADAPSIVAPTGWPAGDLDGDGFADVVAIGSYTSLRLFYGGPNRLIGTLGAAQADAVFLHADGLYSVVGDVDGDGSSDLIRSTARGVSVVYGRPQRWSGMISLPVELDIQLPPSTGTKDAGFGNADVGDLNADGLPDLVLSNPLDSKVYFIAGTGDRRTGELVVGPEHLVLAGERVERFDPTGTPFLDSDGLGLVLDARGDIDGNGSADVLIGAPGTMQPSVVGDAASGGEVLLLANGWLTPG